MLFRSGSFAQETMRTRRIPGTDETLPVIGLGAPRIFIDLPPEGDELPKSVLQTMVDLGGRLLDTPAFFRPDVPVIGKLLTEMGLQQKLFLSGKITVNGKQAGITHLERTVANLNKRPMDLLLIHNMRDLDDHWATLKDWREAGRVQIMFLFFLNDPGATEIYALSLRDALPISTGCRTGRGTGRGGK